MSSRTYDGVALLIGRVIVGGVFLWAAADNLLELDAKSGYAASKGVVAPTALVTLASLILLAGAISILVGFRPPLGVLAVVVFLVPVTIMMHNFWALTGLNQILELHNFQGNVIMLGSAIMSNEGLSVRAKTTRTSAPFTAALIPVPVAVPKSTPPASIA